MALVLFAQAALPIDPLQIELIRILGTGYVAASVSMLALKARPCYPPLNSSKKTRLSSVIVNASHKQLRELRLWDMWLPKRGCLHTQAGAERRELHKSEYRRLYMGVVTFATAALAAEVICLCCGFSARILVQCVSVQQQVCTLVTGFATGCAQQPDLVLFLGASIAVSVTGTHLTQMQNPTNLPGCHRIAAATRLILMGSKDVQI